MVWFWVIRTIAVELLIFICCLAPYLCVIWSILIIFIIFDICFSRVLSRVWRRFFSAPTNSISKSRPKSISADPHYEWLSCYFGSFSSTSFRAQNPFRFLCFKLLMSDFHMRWADRKSCSSSGSALVSNTHTHIKYFKRLVNKENMSAWVHVFPSVLCAHLTIQLNEHSKQIYIRQDTEKR